MFVQGYTLFTLTLNGGSFPNASTRETSAVIARLCQVIYSMLVKTRKSSNSFYE